MDKIVFDIETSNTFADVGGYGNVKDLKVSMVCAYSYNADRYFSFDENNLHEFGPMLQKCGLIIGFAINRFDIPVLKKHYNFDLMAISRLDLLDEVELAVGYRAKLNTLAKINLGQEKTHDGLEAIGLYRDGKIDELREYCLMDVKLTKDLYELAKKQGHLLVPDRTTGAPTRTKLDFKEQELPATLF